MTKSQKKADNGSKAGPRNSRVLWAAGMPHSRFSWCRFSRFPVFPGEASPWLLAQPGFSTEPFWDLNPRDSVGSPASLWRFPRKLGISQVTFPSLPFPPRTNPSPSEAPLIPRFFSQIFSPDFLPPPHPWNVQAPAQSSLWKWGWNDPNHSTIFLKKEGKSPQKSGNRVGCSRSCSQGWEAELGADIMEFSALPPKYSKRSSGGQATGESQPRKPLAGAGKQKPLEVFFQISTILAFNPARGFFPFFFFPLLLFPSAVLGSGISRIWAWSSGVEWDEPEPNHSQIFEPFLTWKCMDTFLGFPENWESGPSTGLCLENTYWDIPAFPLLIFFLG